MLFVSMVAFVTIIIGLINKSSFELLFGFVLVDFLALVAVEHC